MAKRRASRADVAREAGVSKTTVTYVLRDTPNTSISDETKDRVKAAAERLGYVPHFAASSLVRGKTEIIGLLIPSASRQFYSLYSAFLEGLVEESHESPYNFLYVGQDQPEKYRRVLGQGFVDGMIVIQSDTNEEHVQAALSYDRPIVSVNFLPPTAPIPAVSADYEGALETAYDRLLERGRRRIGLFLVDNDLQPNARQMQHHHILAERLADRGYFELVRLASPEAFADAYHRTVGSRRFDAMVLEGGYQLALLLRILDQSGSVVGDDLDIVSINIADFSKAIPSGIFVVESPSQEVGRTAWRTMAAVLEGREVPRRTLVPFHSYVS